MALIKDGALKDKVIKLLLSARPLRDDDMRLIANIWKDELDYENMTGEEVLRAVAKGECSHPESIRRCRQIVQAARPKTRGEAWAKRLGQLEQQERQQVKLVQQELTGGS